MIRECLAACVAAWLVVPAAGCSLILDFSDRAVPADAGPDAPYSAQECAYKEPNDSVAAAASIAPGDTGPAAICAGAVEDHDYYRFIVPSGTTRVEIRVDAMFRRGGDLDLKLYDTSATMLSESRTFMDQERITCPGTVPGCAALAPGAYVFEVFPAMMGEVNRYTFTLTLTP
jgi:hypothetical protein